MIYSGNAMYKLLKSGAKPELHADPFRDRHSSDNNLPVWQGTVVGIDISLDSTNEFSILLDLIWETYKKAIRERKKIRVKKVRFI